MHLGLDNQDDSDIARWESLWEMSEDFSWAQFWDKRQETRGWCSSGPHRILLRPQHREHEAWVTGVTGTKADIILPSHSFRLHGKGPCATLGPCCKRDLINLEQVHRSHDYCTLGLREPLKPRKSCFRSLGGGGDKEETRLQNWNQWTEETRKQLLAQCQSKHSKPRAYKTSCLQAESSPQKAFVCTAVGLQLH